MAFLREYFPSDTLKLINRSEGLAVRDGQRGTAAALGIDDKYVAHSIGRHLVRSIPGGRGTTGSLGAGVKYGDFRDRFLVDGQDNKSSAWAGKGEMAILLCELLNSVMGQHALRLFDRGTRRVVVHYLNEHKLANLLGKTKFLESSILVTPASEALQQVMLTNTKTGAPLLDASGVQRSIMKKVVTPKSAVADVKAKDIIAVKAVIDRHNSELHLQTLYPSDEPVTSYCEWNHGMASLVATADTGKIVQKLMPQAS